MGNIDNSIKVNEKCNKYEIILKLYMTELESIIFPYGILYSTNNSGINGDIIRIFFNYYDKIIDMLYYIDNSYYIHKMIFFANYLLRSHSYIYFNIDIKLTEIIKTLTEIEKEYYSKKI